MYYIKLEKDNLTKSCDWAMVASRPVSNISRQEKINIMVIMKQKLQNYP